MFAHLLFEIEIIEIVCVLFLLFPMVSLTFLYKSVQKGKGNYRE